MKDTHDLSEIWNSRRVLPIVATGPTLAGRTEEPHLMRNLTRSLVLAILVLLPSAAWAQSLEISAIECAANCQTGAPTPSVGQTLDIWLSLTGPGEYELYCVQPLSASALSSYESGQGLTNHQSTDFFGAWSVVGQSASSYEYVAACGPNYTFPYFTVWPDDNPSTGFYPVLSVEYSTAGAKTLNLDISTSNGPVPVAPLQFYVLGTENGTNLGACKQCVTPAGGPINVTNGNVYIQQRDYSVPGLGGGLALTRTWNSRLQDAGPPSVAGMFGQSWRSTYEESLTPTVPQTLMYWRGDGSAWTFTYNTTLNSYSLTSPPDERAQLVSNFNGGFTLTLADGTQKVFNGQNLLAALIDRNHNQTTLAYDTYNRLASVTSPGGSTLTFTYGDPNNPNQATTAQDSVGTVATYTYDSSSRLTKVTYPDGSALNFTNDPNSSMILSVTDSQGKLLESHTYNGVRQGLTSARAYGVDSVSLSY